MGRKANLAWWRRWRQVGGLFLTDQTLFRLTVRTNTLSEAKNAAISSGSKASIFKMRLRGAIAAIWKTQEDWKACFWRPLNHRKHPLGSGPNERKRHNSQTTEQPYLQRRKQKPWNQKTENMGQSSSWEDWAGTSDHQHVYVLWLCEGESATEHNHIQSCWGFSSLNSNSTQSSHCWSQRSTFIVISQEKKCCWSCSIQRNIGNNCRSNVN